VRPAAFASAPLPLFMPPATDRELPAVHADTDVTGVHPLDTHPDHPSVVDLVNLGRHQLSPSGSPTAVDQPIKQAINLVQYRR
jgi:hypothetical protein